MRSAAVRVNQSRGIWILVVLVLTSCATHPSRDFKQSTTGSLPRFSTTPVLSSPASDAPVNVDHELERILAKHRIPGAIAVVLKGTRIVAEGTAGVRKRGASEKVSLDDRFEIASSAKSMSALVISLLVEQGVLDWDRPVPAYFPDERVSPEWQQITLRELLSHTAGLRDPLFAFLRSAYTKHENLREQRASFIRQVIRRPPSRSPGARVVYTNVDYIVAAALAEQVTGESWETLVRREVFAPLGLTSAGFGPPGERGSLSQPWGHGKWRLFQLGLLGNFAFDPDSVGADYPAMASPAGFIHLTAHDWATYVAVQLRAHRLNPKRETLIWTPSVFEPLHELNQVSVMPEVGSLKHALGPKVIAQPTSAGFFFT